MKIFFLFSICLILAVSGICQSKVYPIIENYGGIYNIPDATVKPSQKEYNIIIDVVTSNEEPASLSSSLNNVARLINLHAVGGVASENINVVLAVHGPMTYTLMNNQAYKEKFSVDNPNIELIKALKKANVKITVCGQSMIGRDVGHDQLLDEVEVATSMLTTVTTYQLKGYAMLKF